MSSGPPRTWSLKLPAKYQDMWPTWDALLRYLEQWGGAGGGGGTVEFATCPEADAGTNTTKAINPEVGACSYDRKRVWGQHEAGKGTETVTLTPDTGVITVDGRLSNVFRVVLDGDDYEFANPVNPISGQTINIHLIQDVTGGRQVTFASQWKFTNRIDPVLTEDGNAEDMLSCQWDETAAAMKCSFIPNFGAGYTPPPTPDFEDFDFVNVGGGNELFRDVDGLNVNLRTIVGEGDVAVTTDGDKVVVSYSAPAVSTVESLDDLLDVDAPAPAVGDTLTWNGTSWVPAQGRKWTLGATWTNGANVLATPVNAVHALVSEPATIVGWYILTDSDSGSCVIDVRRTTLASYPADAGDTLCSGVEPGITNAYSANDTDLTGWTVALAEGDVLQFVLESVSGFTTVQIILVLQRDN